MIWNDCNVWARFGSRSLGTVLSLLRWTMLLHEELVCRSQTCYPIGNDNSVTIAHVVRSRTKRVLITCNGLKDVAVALCGPTSHANGQWLVALLSNLLHCLWMTGLAATSPMTVKSVTSANESRMNEPRVSALHFVPNLGCCIENRWSCKWLLKLLSLLQEFSFFCHWFS